MGECMSDGFENDDAAKPAVHQIVGVEGNTQKGNERVVPPSESEQRDLFNSDG